MNKIADAPPVPATLIDAIRYFSDPDRALAFMVELRWPNGVTCPTCGGQSVSFVKTRRVWTCRGQHPRKQFSVKIGTIFEDSPIGLDKWFAAMWLIGNAKNGISSYEIARGIHVTQKTAWFMLHRIRLAMQRGTFDKLAGEVEADETFIGGKARFMHAHKRAAKITGTGGKDKSAVMGLLERHGPDGHSRVRVKHVANTRRSRWRRKSGRTSSLVLTSTPMRSSPMMGCPTPTLTRSSTTPKPMFEGTFILTGWKTSGLCSSARSREPMFPSSRSTCSGTWTKRRTDLTHAKRRTGHGSSIRSALSLASVSPQSDRKIAARYDVMASRDSGGANAMKSDLETAQAPTPWEKFLDLARKVVQTPKAEVDKRERAWRAERKKRKR